MSLNLPERYVDSGSKASGGQGTVYFCKDKNLDRDVAIKVFNDVDDDAAFQKEVQARQKIQSKHVVQIFDYWVDDDDGPTLVLEMIAGAELSKSKGKYNNYEELLLVAYQIACGIDDIHKAGLIHRDIKPHNMKRGKDKIVKIFDLGLTCGIGTSSAMTTKMAGTPGFRAPEYYRPGPVKLTQAVDVYAFGVSLWYLLAGKLPTALLEIPPQDNSSVESLSTQLPLVDVGVIAVLDHCLEKNQNARPSMAEVKAALELQLTKDKHRGVVVLNGTAYTVDVNNRGVKINGTHGTVSIRYNGIRFVVTNYTGEVWINNAVPMAGMKLHDSCVICFGNQSRGMSRVFMPFNVSKPEVVL